MDDDIYGKTLFKLSFYEAVKKKILTVRYENPNLSAGASKNQIDNEKNHIKNKMF